ncbi:hypothetical protein HYT25_00300 [Candidatus Pacearchaeota archaeon]|nr:hypothetical protein [Candidatus Pacearchaeota archaeon]
MNLFLVFLETASYISFLLSFIIIATTNFKIDDIKQNFSKKNYFIGIFLSISLLAALSFIIRRLFNLLKYNLNLWEAGSGDITYLNNYLYLGLAIILLTFLGGYYYVSEEPDNKLRKFLKVLFFTLINSFAGVSALKSILQIN